MDSTQAVLTTPGCKGRTQINRLLKKMDSVPKLIDRSRETKKQKIDKLAAELSEYFSGPTLDLCCVSFA